MADEDLDEEARRERLRQHEAARRGRKVTEDLLQQQKERQTRREAGSGAGGDRPEELRYAQLPRYTPTGIR
ncbi:hypothetical protein [Streptomyces sp. NBC_00470]|uniref:hypothetical protein n=1 Tax=Streptomyces sp. NBC_00470 TaxID=2975753 RepID=UPI002F91BA4A